MKEAPRGQWTPSRVVGYVAFYVIMLVAIVAAADQFAFETVGNLVNDLTAFSARVILGIVIIAIGLLLAHLAGKAIEATKRQQAGLLALLARIAILLLAGAMGLQAMGFANDVINLGFGLILGAVAVAVAVAFGIGGISETWSPLANVILFGLLISTGLTLLIIPCFVAVLDDIKGSRKKAKDFRLTHLS